MYQQPTTSETMGWTLHVLELSDFGPIPYNMCGDPTFGLQIAHAIIDHVDTIYRTPMVCNDWLDPAYDDNLVCQLIFDRGGFELMDTLVLEQFIEHCQVYAKNVSLFYKQARLSRLDRSLIPDCRHVKLSNRLTREVAFVY